MAITFILGVSLGHLTSIAVTQILTMGSHSLSRSQEYVVEIGTWRIDSLSE